MAIWWGNEEVLSCSVYVWIFWPDIRPLVFAQNTTQVLDPCKWSDYLPFSLQPFRFCKRIILWKWPFLEYKQSTNVALRDKSANHSTSGYDGQKVKWGQIHFVWNMTLRKKGISEPGFQKPYQNRRLFENMYFVLFFHPLTFQNRPQEYFCCSFESHHIF